MVSTLVTLAVVAILLAFVLAAVEEALWRVSRVHAAEMFEDGKPGSTALVRILDDSAAYLSVTTFVRVVCESAAMAMITVAVKSLVAGTWKPLFIAVGIMALMSFVVVGVSPRTLGRQHVDSVARLGAPVVVWLRRVLGPLARLLVAIGNAVTPGRGYRDGPFQSESELRDLVDLAGENSLIEADEREMIHSVFELGDTTAREVMVPRTDMVTIDHERLGRHAMSLFLRSGFSRIPVVGEGSDDVLGLLYFKDVARRLNGDPDAGSQQVTAMMRPIQYVPESKPVDDLLRDMQREQSHFALVVDEYGGTAGLVTIEDIIEEIVGEIADEYDREEPEVEDLGDGRYRVEATMAIEDLGDLFGIELEDDEVATVGGLIGKTIGKVPIVGSSCEVHGLSLVAERMAGRRHRIASVIVERVAEPAAAAETDPEVGSDRGRGKDRTRSSGTVRTSDPTPDTDPGARPGRDIDHIRHEVTEAT
jgi:CBS domain containing-hemolysin-like protein